MTTTEEGQRNNTRVGLSGPQDAVAGNYGPQNEPTDNPSQVSTRREVENDGDVKVQPCPKEEQHQQQ